jgi:phage host-nuclease inhibitor protein Gam
MVSDPTISVKELEEKVSDLENEAARLSLSLDAQKTAASEQQAVAAKKLEDMAKELQEKVIPSVSSCWKMD